MARIRTIKPEFFTSEDIVKLSTLARLLYVALWCESDKEGRMVWKPMTFKLRYLPADDCQINELCQELVDSGLVVLYGDGYAYIPSFKAHQHINPRESESQLPAPDEKVTRKARVGTRQSRESDAQGGREGKGKEGKAHDFDIFWLAYPNKKSKEAALKAWAKINPNEQLKTEIFDGLQRAKTSADWLKDGGAFIPHPATWLNGKRWLDEFGGVTPQKEVIL